MPQAGKRKPGPLPPASAPWWLRRRVALLSAVVFLFAGLLYVNTLRNGFVWDDRVLVLENPDLATLDWTTVENLFTTHYWDMTGKPGGLYRPLSALTFRLDCQLYQKHPAGYHLTNTLLNAAVCTLAFLFLLQLFGGLSSAFMAALVFASLPLHTENVAWVAGRTDILATLMMLASLLGHAWWRRSGRAAGMALSLAAFVAAVLAKEIALILPPIVLLLELGPFDRLHGGGSNRRRAAATSLPYFAIAGLFFVVRKMVLGASVQSFAPFAEGAVATAALGLSILAHYVYTLVFPFNLNAESEFPAPDRFLDFHTIAGLAMLMAMMFVLYRWRRRGDVVFGIAVFLIGIAPVLNVVPAPEISAERFLYFPSLGFAVVVAALAAAGMRRWRAATIVAFAFLVIACGVRTVSRNGDWFDEATLFRATVAAAGNSARAHLNLGNTLYRDARYQEALAEYQRAVDVDPGFAAAWSGLARAHKELGRMDDAFSCMRRALSIEPGNANFNNTLGLLFVHNGEYADAGRAFRRALELKPDHRQARFNLGLALFRQNDYAGAVRELVPLPYKNTDFVLAYFYLAEAEARLGNRERASAYAADFLSRYESADDFRARAQQLLSGVP